MTTEQILDRHIALKRREAFRLEGPAGTKIRVTNGGIWITRHNDTRDYLLVAGDALEHTGEGTTLLTAFKDAGVQILRPGTPRPVWAAFRNFFRPSSGVA